MIPFYLKLPAVQWESSTGMRAVTVSALKEDTDRPVHKRSKTLDLLPVQAVEGFLRKAFHSCLLGDCCCLLRGELR